MTGLNTKTATEIELLQQIVGQLLSIQVNTGHLSVIAADISWIRAAIAPTQEQLPQGAKVSMAWSLYRLMDAIAPDWPRPTGEPVQPALLTLIDNLAAWKSKYDLDITDTAFQLDQILNNVGYPTGDATTTVLGYLAAIKRSSACACGPQPPTDEPPAGCANGGQSIPSPLVLSEAYPGRAFATWGDLPAGVELGLWSQDLVVSAQLHVTASTPISVYALSKKSGTFSANPTLAAVFPTNQWVVIAETLNLAFSVPADADLVVYLCVAPAGGWLDCVTLHSSSGTVSGGNLDNAPVLAVSLSGIPGINADNVLEGPQDFTYTIGGCVAYENWNGVTVELLTEAAAPYVRVVYQQASDGDLVTHGLAVNEVYTIPEDTTEVVIDSAYQAPFGTTAFDVRICPPA